MSNSPDTDFDLELHFLPAWAQKAPDQNRYAKYAGEPGRSGDDRRERGPRSHDRSSRQRGPSSQRPPRRDFGRPPRRDDDQRTQAGRGGPEAGREVIPAPPLPEISVA